MRRRRSGALFGALLAMLCLCSGLTIAGAQGTAPILVTVQLLDYEKGFIFFTTGDGFRVDPAVQIVDYRSGALSKAAPTAREYARVTFDQAGVVTKIELSPTPLPTEGDLSAVHRFAIALSTPAPNPELNPAHASGSCAHTIAGRRVTVTFNIQVPSTTQPTDTVYMTTDQSGWNVEAYRLDRVDALHYRTALPLLSGTVLHYLFDRGSSRSIQHGENGIEQEPYVLCVSDADAQAVGKIVYHWGDERPTGSLPVPQTMPTPYNPAPFPNLPTTPPPHPTHGPSS